MAYWETKKFKDLQKAWYDKLSEDGFKDVEKVCGNELQLRQSAMHPYCKAGVVLDELDRYCVESYFIMLSQFANNSSFDDKVDELILGWYADGRKIKAICEELQKRGDYRCRVTVRMTIRKYEMLWGIKKYTPKQLNKKA